ncbi:RDD family protein [Devosia sp. A8/3-2]|nr:RDD family protein [Devosia sp. A8/3-2]
MNQTQTARPQLPAPETAPELFDGVLTRRAVAFVIDLTIMGMLMLMFGLIGVVAGFLTFGLAWLALVFLVPATVLFYYGVTLGSPSRATLGMRMMDLVLTPTRGQPLDGWMAIIHAGLFWVTFWISGPFRCCSRCSRRAGR